MHRSLLISNRIDRMRGREFDDEEDCNQMCDRLLGGLVAQRVRRPGRKRCPFDEQKGLAGDERSRSIVVPERSL